MDNRILFLQKCLLNSSPHFIRLLSELLNLIGCLGQDKKLIFEKKVCFSRTISRLKVTYMLMTFATSLVVLFKCYATADILKKLLQQCFLFSLLLLYLGNSQVSVYRTIGPTLVLVDVILILQSSLCMFSNTSHYVGRGYRHLTQQPLHVSQHFSLSWSRLLPSYREISVFFPTLPIMLIEVIPILQSNLCVCFPTLPIMYVEVIPFYRETSVCFPKRPIILVEVILILQRNLCMFPNTYHHVGRGYPYLRQQILYVSYTSHYVGQGYPHLTQQPLYVFQHFPLCWSRLSPSYRATSICFSTLPIMLVKVIPILHNSLCMFPNTSIMLVEVIPILQSNICMFSSTSHYVGQGYLSLTKQPLCASQHIPLCRSGLSPSYKATSV